MNLHLWITLLTLWAPDVISAQTSPSSGLLEQDSKKVEYPTEIRISAQEFSDLHQTLIQKIEPDIIGVLVGGTILSALCYNTQVKGVGSSLMWAATVVLSVIGIVFGTVDMVSVLSRELRDSNNDRKLMGAQLRQAKSVSLPVAKAAACVRMKDMVKAVEQAAEEQHGVKTWKELSQTFEIIFEAAQDVAHQKVIGNITSIQPEGWPLLPALPAVIQNPSPSQELISNQELKKWGDENLMTIPLLKRQIAARYTNMHFTETLETVFLQRNHPTFFDKPVAFEDLSRSYVYLASFPLECVSHVPESKTDLARFQNMRLNKGVRESRVTLALQAQYDAKTELSKKMAAL